jgi:hypothetical protein
MVPLANLPPVRTRTQCEDARQVSADALQNRVRPYAAGQFVDARYAHLLRREHSKEADCAITDNGYRLARSDIGGDSNKPASAENIQRCQQARDQVV